MAAPSPVARTNPSDTPDIPLQDGHPTKVTLNTSPAFSVWENSTTPPGVDGGDPVDLTTFFNLVWRTFGPRTLKTLTEMRFVGLYDPVVWEAVGLAAAINRLDTITVTFADGSTLAFYGYLRAFNPQEHVEGTPPLAEMVVQPTNWDPVNDVEEGPAVAEASGT